MSTRSTQRLNYSNLMAGGYGNAFTGAGGQSDKAEHSFFSPTRIYSREPLEVIYRQSWAAKKLITIPVEDMLIRWREFTGEEGDSAVEAMKEAEERHHVQRQLTKAMISGRLFGTAILCFMSTEAPLESPLMPEQIRPGDLKALRVVDRYSAYVSQRDKDPFSPTYGQPLLYFIHPVKGTGFYIHASRTLKFDGEVTPTDDGSSVYDYDFGESILISAMTSIMQDSSLAQAVAHLSQMASVQVLAVDGLRETLMGSAPGEATVSDIGQQVNDAISNWRLLMLDKGTEEYTKVATNFSGFEAIMEMMHKRLAAAADIPMTRFFGQSPAGMNATGESDMQNYAAMIEAKRGAMLKDPMMMLDRVLARDAGIAEPPEFTWRSLMDMSDTDVATNAKMKAEALQIAIMSGMIDEDDGRAALDGDPVFGPLPGEAPELPEPEPAALPTGMKPKPSKPTKAKG